MVADLGVAGRVREEGRCSFFRSQVAWHVIGPGLTLILTTHDLLEFFGAALDYGIYLNVTMLTSCLLGGPYGGGYIHGLPMDPIELICCQP